MSTYATDRPIQEVRQPDASFIADDPSDTSLEEVQQSDPLLLPLPPVELCLVRHTCLRLQRQSHLPKF